MSNKKCDVCGTRYTLQKDGLICSRFVLHQTFNDNTGMVTYKRKSFDLCPKCFNEIAEKMENKQKSQSNES